MNNWLYVDKKQLLQDLKEHVLEVTFTKVNGDRRVMTCTLQEQYLPKLDTDGSKNYEPNTDGTACSVWDTNAQGWRSFRWANVEEIRFINEPVSEANHDAQQ